MGGLREMVAFFLLPCDVPAWGPRLEPQLNQSRSSDKRATLLTIRAIDNGLKFRAQRADTGTALGIPGCRPNINIAPDSRI